MTRYTSFQELKAAEESAFTSGPVNPEAEKSIIAALATIRKAVVKPPNHQQYISGFSIHTDNCDI